jgi:hypothetical protein
MFDANVLSHDARSTSQRRWQTSGWMRSPWAPAIAVILLYTAWLASAALTGHRATDFAWIGSPWVNRSSASALIRAQPVHPYQYGGYDGQFYYFVALDPSKARYYIDQPSYRYGRVMYPIAARFLGLQRANLIPYSLIAVNWLALFVGTLAVAAWLKRAGFSPWFAAAFGLSPGLFIALQRDLTEALAYALVAIGVYMFDFGGRFRLPGAAFCFALAVLTRETVAVFPLIYGASLLGRSESPRDGHLLLGANRRQAALFLSACLVPFLVYKIFLYVWLGSSGVMSQLLPQLLPFGGILGYWPWQAQHIEEVISIVLPAVIWLWMCLRAFRRRLSTVAVWTLAANVVLFVVVLNQDSYANIISSGRIAMGVPLALLYCLPVFDRMTGRDRRWLWVSFTLWLAPGPSLWLYWHHRPIVIDLIALCVACLVFGIVRAGMKLWTDSGRGRRSAALPLSSQ